MPHTPSPRPHLLRYVASRGISFLCIERACGNDQTGSNYVDYERATICHRCSERELCARRLLHAVSQVTTYMGSRSILALIAIAILIDACGPAINEVRVEPGTTPLKPVFVLTDTTGRGSSGTIYGLSVVPCGADTAVWQIAATGSKSAPPRIAYGDTVPGYVASVGPAPLHAGCYDVFVTDGRRSRFRVDGAGRVIVEARRDTSRRDTTRR